MNVEKDVAAVLALEAPVNALLEAIKAAQPAIERLEAAEYVGAGWVEQHVGSTIFYHDEGTLLAIAQALELFRESNGSQAAWDLKWYGKILNETTDRDKAAKAMVEAGENFDRVEAMRQFAASVA